LEDLEQGLSQGIVAQSAASIRQFVPSPTDQLLGTLAVRHGFVTEAQVQALLQELPEDRSLGQLLRERSLIPESALPTLQRELSMARFLRAERGFAHLCVERGILTTEVARVLLEEQRQAGNTYRLGERLVKEGRIERPALEKLLEELFARLAAGNAPANSEPTASTIIRSAEAGTPGSEVMKAVDARTPPAPPPMPPTQSPQVPQAPQPKSASRDGGAWTLTPGSTGDEPAPDGTIARNSNAFPFPSAEPAAPTPTPPANARPSAAFPFPPQESDPLARATPLPAPAEPDPTIALDSAQLPFGGGQPAPDGTVVLGGAQHPYPPGVKPPDGTVVLDGGRLPYEGSKGGGARRPRKPTKIIDTTPASPDMTFDYEGDDAPAPNPTPQPLAPGAVATPSPDMTFDYEGDPRAERTLELDAPPQFGDPNALTAPIPSPFAQDNALTAPIPSPFSGKSPFPGTPGSFDGSAGFDAGGATLPIQRPGFPPRPPSDSDSDSDSDSGLAPKQPLGDTMADRTSDLTGTLLNNRYQILARVGQGGMGQVFKADHTLMGRTVAIKVLNPNLVTSEESVARFKREIMTLAQFEHPNVVRLFDAGTTQGGRFYMAMEFVEGEPLSRVLAGSGRLELKRFARLFAQVLQGVGKAHERNIVHRDLKTENLLVTTLDSGAEVVKIMDFGIAKLLGDEPTQNSDPFLTAERVAVGTPEYMSPEQAAGGAQVDHRSDLYSLGVVAFELLTGRLPFEAESPVGYIGKHIVDPPFTFEEAQPGLGYPPAVERFVLKALEKEPSERYQSAEEMLDALEVALPRDLQDRLRQERSSDPRIPAVAAPTSRPAPSSGSSQRASRGDDMMAKLLRVGVGLAALLTLCIGAALAYKTATRGRPATEVLAEGTWEADYAAGRFAKAKEQLEQAKDEVRKEDQGAVNDFLGRVQKGEALAGQLAKAQKAWKAALVDLDAAVEQGRHAPAETSLEAARRARAMLADAQEALQAEGLPEVAGPGPESLEGREAAVSLLLELSTAAGLIVQGVHSTAISRLDTILSKTPPQSPVYGRARRLRAKARSLELLEKAEAELAKSAERDYADARGNVAQAEKLARTESLTEVMARVRALREKLAEAEQGDVLAKSRQAVLEALARGKAARAGRDFTKAVRALEEARALAKKNNLSELAKKAEEEIAGAELEASSFDAFRALPSLDPEGPVDQVREAIAAREAYLVNYPRGIEVGEIMTALPKHKARLRARESQEKRAAFDDLVKRAKAAGSQDPRLAAELAGKAAELGKAAGFDVGEVAALAKSSKDALRKSLLAEKLQDFVKIGEVYVCRFEVSNNEYLRFVFNQRKAKQPFEKLWPNHWEAKGDKGLRFYPEGQGLHPVGGISHARAAAYCAWRTAEWQKQVPGVKVRLPTKDEWEAAARGGTQRAYPWGEEWNPDRVIFKRGDEEGSATSRGDAAETLAGHTPETKILHMAGNVAEWTSTPGTDDEGLEDLSQRLLKGGSYRSFRKELLRIEASEQGGTQESELHWGFRVVVEFD
jgi:formylglycine-generating enzyme required for sulfatase activity